MMFVLLIGLSAAVVVGFACVQMKARRLSGTDWEELVSRIQPIPFEGLARVALDHLQPNSRQLELQPQEIWESVGGLEGLRRMRHNAELIIQLAAYVRHWNFDEALVVAERIRFDAVLLKRALFRIEMQAWFGLYKLRAPFYVHQAASAYYLMTRRVLALYQTNQYLLYPRLAEVL